MQYYYFYGVHFRRGKRIAPRARHWLRQSRSGDVIVYKCVGRDIFISDHDSDRSQRLSNICVCNILLLFFLIVYIFVCKVIARIYVQDNYYGNDDDHYYY